MGFNYISLMFLIGNLFLMQMPEIHPAWISWSVCISLSVLILPLILGHFAVACQNKNYYKALFLCACIGFGFSYSAYRAQLILDHQFPKELEKRNLLIKGKIVSLPVFYASQKNPHQGMIRFKFEVDAAQSLINNWTGTIQLSWYQQAKSKMSELLIGDTWQLLVKLKRPSTQLNPAGMDKEKMLFAKAINATGYIKEQPLNQLLEANRDGYYRFQQFRQQLIRQMQENLSYSSNQGIYLALLFGYKNDMTHQQWDLLTKTGTNHLMAISGLHIGLLAAIGFFLGRFIASLNSRWIRNIPAQHFAAILAIVFAFFYAALAGFSIPTQRALIMVLVFMLSILMRIHLTAMKSLSISLLLILLIEPLSTLSIGFWLSFAAVFFILSCLRTSGLSNDLTDQNFEKKKDNNHLVYKMIQFIKSLIWIQIVLFIGLLPLLVIFFHQFALYSPLANILVVPWMSFVIIPACIFFAPLYWLFPKLADDCYQLLDMLFNPVWQWLSFLVELPYQQISVPNHYIFWIILVVAPLLIKKLYQQSHFSNAQKNSILGGIGLIFSFFVWLSYPKKTEQGNYHVSVLDVGQGLSVFIQTAHHQLLYDTGTALFKNYDMANQVILPFFLSRGIEQLDILILSHGDKDHVGAALTLKNRMTIHKIISGEPARITKLFAFNSVQCHEGMYWQWDGVDFYLLHPEQNSRLKGNNASCVLLIKGNNGFSTLLAGDIEKTVEKKLVQQVRQIETIDLLIAPHHGSKTSSSIEMIKQWKPRKVVFSAGYKNPFHHPTKEVVRLYRENKSQLYSTNNGMIDFDSKNGAGFIYRRDFRHFWNRPYQPDIEE